MNSKVSREVKGNKATFKKHTQHDARKQTEGGQPSSNKHEKKGNTARGKKTDHRYMMRAGSWQQLPGTQTADMLS